MEVLEQKLKNAVCRIEMKNNEGVLYEGTGFLFMTAAHIFQDGRERRKGIHSFLRDASFKVSFHVRHPNRLGESIQTHAF